MQTIDPSCFVIKPLTKDLDVSSFCSSDDDLNDYLKENALRDKSFLYSITKVVEYNGKIIGFFSLVADTIEPNKVDEEVSKKYDYAKLPSIKIARLATDKNYMGLGVGTAMMKHIFRIVLDIVEDIGCRVITVDAKRDAQGFYEHFAFEMVKSKKQHETIPMYMDLLPLIDMS